MVGQGCDGLSGSVKVAMVGRGCDGSVEVVMVWSRLRWQCVGCNDVL